MHQHTNYDEMKFIAQFDETDKDKIGDQAAEADEQVVKEALFEEVQKGSKVTDAIKKSSTILLLISASLSNMCFFTHNTNINTLQAQIQQELKINESQYGLITTFLTIPSIIVPLFLGAFIDQIGARKSLAVGSMILVLGDLIILFGVTNKNLKIVLAGSFIFGIGTDSIVISKAKIIQKWFKGKHFALATGFGAVLIALCNIMLSSLSPVLYNVNNSLFLPFFVQACLAVLSFCMSCLAGLIDKQNEAAFLKFSIKEKIEKFSLATLKQFTKLYWYICFSGVLSYGTYSLLNLISSKFCQVRFGFSNSQSGFLRSIPQFGVVPLPLAIGWYTDRFGKRIHIMTMGVIFLMSAFILNAQLPNCDGCYSVVAPFILEGFYIGIFGVIFYPMIGLVVKTENIGVAVGAFTWLLGLFCGMLSFIDGILIDKTSQDEHHGYQLVFWFLFTFQIACLVLLILALRKDLKLGSLLSGRAKTN